MQRSGSDVTSEAREARMWVERAERHALHIPMRYRIEGQQEWSPGETVNLSESGVLFSSESMLEVDDRLEITFQTSGAPLLSSSMRLARVVRRVLNNWPETRPMIAVRFHS
ncbi:MAG TPA: PilZ domain-containing protein [Candidatus Angelobacter sp.]